VILAAALLEILSVLPAKETVRTDETFTFAVRLRNAGPDAAQEVKLRAGSNASALIHAIEGPPDWKCDQSGPRFTSVTICSTATMPALAEVEFRVTAAAPQPSAVTFRVGAAVSAKGIPSKRLEANLNLIGADSRSELSTSARKIDDERAAFDVRNDGPDDAKEVVVVIANAALASAEDWTCAPTGHGVVCRRATMKAGTASTFEARGKSSAAMEAQVRAELNLEEKPRDNAARPQ
jgi:hypothetical protein